MSINRLRTLLTLAAALLLAACVEKTPLSAEQMPYAGYWVGQDGSTIHIWANGGGDFKVQGKSVTGGRAEIVSDRLNISLWFIEQEWRITKPPSRHGGADEMTLDNQAFRHRVEKRFQEPFLLLFAPVHELVDVQDRLTTVTYKLL